MESKHLMIAILGTALAIGSGIGFKAYLQQRRELLKSQLSKQTKLELAKEETKRYQILVQAIQGNPYLTEDKVNAIHHSQAQMLQALKPEDKAYFLADMTVGGADAKQITQKEKKETGPKDIRLDGTYRILNVNARIKKGFELSLYNTQTQQKFHAIVEQANLTEQGTNLLKDATFNKEDINLQVNAQLINGEIKNAKVMEF